jgi:predicted ArsR family transcriptional regulator
VTEEPLGEQPSREEPLRDELARLEPLAEPTRRRLYAYVVSRPEPVGRDEAAERLGLPRHVVKFHLDRLVESGLLVPEYRRLSGRSGPGAGRPAKLYHRAPDEVSVTVPPRRYDLVGEVLASAVERAAETGQELPAAVEATARSTGAELGAASAGTVVGALSNLGYEPRLAHGRLELANCPYRALAAGHVSLVCGMNLALVEGLLSALPPSSAVAHLNPGEGRCCVVVDLPPAAEAAG